MRPHLTVEQRQLALRLKAKGLVVAGDRPAGGPPSSPNDPARGHGCLASLRDVIWRCGKPEPELLRPYPSLVIEWTTSL
jgi:hypothetical protein